jgi:hypothetical protein
LDGWSRTRAPLRRVHRRPGLAVYSEQPTHFERIDGAIDGPMLIAAASAVIGHRSDAYVWLLERAVCDGSQQQDTLYLSERAQGADSVDHRENEN